MWLAAGVGGAIVIAAGAWYWLTEDSRLAAKVREGDESGRLSAVDELSRHSSRGADQALEDATRDASARVACRAVTVLAMRADQRHLETFRATARDQRPEVRAASMLALAGLNKKQTDIPLLVATLDNAGEAPQVRAAAANALGTLQAKEEAAEALAKALDDPSPLVFEAVRTAIERMAMRDFRYRPTGSEQDRKAAIMSMKAWASLMKPR